MGLPESPFHDEKPASTTNSHETLAPRPSGIRIETEPQTETKENLTSAEKYEVSVFRGVTARKLAQISTARQLENLDAGQLQAKIGELVGPLPSGRPKIPT